MQFNTLHIYYLATPVFFILHYAFDINLRIVIPGAPDGWLYAYYLFCFVAAFTAFNSVLTGAIFALIESSVNILLLLLNVLLPIYTIGHDGAAFENTAFGVPELVHFLIAGSILLYSFYRNPLVTGNGLYK